MKMNINLMIAFVGLLVLLVGLIFYVSEPNKFGVLVIPLTGVGTSVLATGLTSWLVTKHIGGIDVTSIVQALRENSNFVRMNHTLKIVFTLTQDNVVHLDGEHIFTLVNQKNRLARKTFEIYTDLGGWNKRGGFRSVVEPSNNVLEGISLTRCIMSANGKTYFTKGYDIPAKSGAIFQFNTFGNYRRVDRLIWTVQDLSMDFTVTLVNNTGIKNAFFIKVNHHRERDIRDRLTNLPASTDGQEIVRLDFKCEVLPYQGFEVMWDFESVKRSLPESEVESAIPAHAALMPPH